MSPAPAEVYVIILLLAPLSAMLLSLLGKLLPPLTSPVPSFLVWSLGSGWALWRTVSVTTEKGPLHYTVGGWREPFGIVLELNGISWTIGVLSLLIISSVWLSTYRRKNYGPSFYLILYLTQFSLQGILYSRDLFNLFIWFEVLSLCSIILVAYERSPASLLAAFRYLLLSTISIVLYLIGVWIIYTYSGSLAFGGIANYLKSSPAVPGGGGAQKSLAIAISLITAGVITRSAVVPFHTWLPPVHSSAPYPVSALLSGLVIKIPLLALWHFYAYLPLFPLSRLLIWIGFASAVIGGAGAVVQSDAKRILAYSSIGQIGFITAAFAAALEHSSPNTLAAGDNPAGTAALFYICMHALSKALLFLSVGYVTHISGCRNVQHLRGMQRRFPLTALLYWSAAFTLMGVPFSGGYYAKLLVSSSLYGYSGAWLLTIAGGLTALALFKLGRIFTGPSPADMPPPEDKPHSPGIAMAILGTACIALAVFPRELFSFLHSLLIDGGGATGQETHPTWFLSENIVKSAVVTLIGFTGMFILQIETVKSWTQRLTGMSAGLNGALRLLTAGMILFITFAAIFL